MREIRAEATYVLNVLSLLHQLKPFFHNTQSVINIHTRSQGLINKSTRHINITSLVTSDHIDIFYQIRQLMNDLNVKISLILTQATPKEIPITEAKKPEHKNDDDTVYTSVPHDPNEINIDSDSDSSSIETTLDDVSKQDSPIQCVESTPDEKLMREYLDQAYAYYNDRTSTKPSQHAILFPAQQICITYNKQPVVANLATFLQETERKAIREEYFEQRMGIMPSCLPRIDTYALGRVLKRTKPYRNIYFKIMHKQLNTMMVNQQWMQSDPICPFCKKSKETWIHVITCNAPVRKAIRDKYISDFDLMLSQHKTYPPLHEFFLKFITNLNFSPHEPVVVNSNFCTCFASVSSS